jgi:hypothetical protein
MVVEIESEGHRAFENMRVKVEIPALESILSNGHVVPLARGGAKWTSRCLGRDGKGVGVYAIHHNGELKYIGKTNGPTMSFSTRLRRELQEIASGGKHIYPKLASLTVPPDIKVTLFTKQQIEELVAVEGTTLAPWQKIEIFEATLIQVLGPSLQLHQLGRMANYAVRRISPEKIDQIISTQRNRLPKTGRVPEDDRRDTPGSHSSARR